MFKYKVKTYQSVTQYTCDLSSMVWEGWQLFDITPWASGGGYTDRIVVTYQMPENQKPRIQE